MVAMFCGSRTARDKSANARSAHADLTARLEDASQRWSLTGATDVAPIVICAAGWRSGSTLLQRMIMSDPRVMIWGEPYDHAAIVQSMADQWRCFTSSWPRDGAFRVDGLDDVSDRWIANLYPPVQDLYASHIEFFKRLFMEPAERHGRPRWGLKEVKLSVDHATYIRWLFPRAKFVFLMRNPISAYESYKPYLNWFRSWPGNPVMTPLQFGNMWRDLVANFMAGYKLVDGLLVRYEDLGARVPELRAYLDVAVAAPDRLPVVRGPDRPRMKINGLEAFILNGAVAGVARNAGY
jgi:hypothetical protein